MKDIDQLHHILSKNPAVIFTCVADGVFHNTFISANVENIFGHKAESFLTDKFFWEKNLHPDDKATVMEHLTKTLFEKNHVMIEYRFRTKNGKYKWIHDEMYLIRDDAGNPQEIIGSWMDITSQKEMEERLDHSNEQYRLIAEASLDGICSVDTKGYFIFVNNAFAGIYGYEPERLIKTHFSFLFAHNQEEKVTAVFDRLLAGDTARGSFVGKHKNGSSISIGITAAPMKKNGSIVGITAVVRDMTSQRENDTQLVKQMTQIERLEQENKALRAELEEKK